MTQAPDFFDQLQAEQTAAMMPLERLRERIEWTRINSDRTRDRIHAIATAGALLAGEDRADLVAIFSTLADLTDEMPGVIEIELALRGLEGGAA